MYKLSYGLHHASKKGSVMVQRTALLIGSNFTDYQNVVQSFTEFLKGVLTCSPGV